MKKIIVISEYFYPSTRTDAILVTQIAKKFFQMENVDLKVISTTPLEKGDEIDKIESQVIRLKNSSLSDTNIIIRILKFLILTFRLSFQTIKTVKKGNIVFSTTNPIFLIPVLVILKKIISFKYILLVYDVFPENLSSAKLLNNKTILYKIIKFFYDYSYKNVDCLVVIGRDMKEVINKKVNNKVPISIIENWCDLKNITPISKKESKIIQKLNLEDKKVFTFSGNLGRVQGIANLLKASLLVKDNSFRLLFIGSGVMQKEIEKFIKETKSVNVLFAGSFPIEMQNDFLNACDISIISLSKNMYGLGVPSKSYYNMAAAKPLLYIGEKNSEIDLVINEHKIGWSVEPENPYELAKVIDTICNDFKSIENRGKKSRMVVENYFTKDIILNKYEKMIEKI